MTTGKREGEHRPPPRTFGETAHDTTQEEKRGLDERLRIGQGCANAWCEPKSSCIPDKQVEGLSGLQSWCKCARRRSYNESPTSSTVPIQYAIYLTKQGLAALAM